MLRKIPHVPSYVKAYATHNLFGTYGDLSGACGTNNRPGLVPRSDRCAWYAASARGISPFLLQRLGPAEALGWRENAGFYFQLTSFRLARDSVSHAEAGSTVICSSQSLPVMGFKWT